jgi:hypothetical protein
MYIDSILCNVVVLAIQTKEKDSADFWTLDCFKVSFKFNLRP